jgi:hypothetical protein
MIPRDLLSELRELLVCKLAAGAEACMIQSGALCENKMQLGFMYRNEPSKLWSVFNVCTVRRVLEAGARGVPEAYARGDAAALWPCVKLARQGCLKRESHQQSRSDRQFQLFNCSVVSRSSGFQLTAYF